MTVECSASNTLFCIRMKWTENKLLWIRLLMIVSQSMLLVIVVSWLYAQYATEKTQLTNDLQGALESAQGKVEDSLLQAKFLTPTLKHAQQNQDSNIVIERKAGAVKNVSMVFKTDESTDVDFKQLEKHVSTLHGFKDKTFVDSKGKKRVIYIAENKEASQNAVKPLMTLMMRKLIKMGIDDSDLDVRMDTLALKQNFEKLMRQNGWHFSVIWNGSQSGKDDDIFIRSSFFNNTYRARINDYSTYIVKRLTPQILFTLFLLTVTATAFLFTYNTLKKQMWLGVIKNEFISNMSHELKTPISTVKVAIEALNNYNTINDPQIAKEYLQMASLEMDRLEMLVNKALNTSLLEEGKIVLQKERVDLKQLTERLLHAMQPRFRQAGADVHLEAKEGTYWTMADILHLQGVLINLIDNSLKYAKEPIIQVRLSSGATEIMLSVIDNGPGIAEEYQDKIFEKFFRIPSGDTHDVKGYGLGLSYVRQVVAQHAGNINIKNLDPGVDFTITLPKA